MKEGDNADRLLEKYQINTILSESMFPTLHYLEICLRNRIDQVLKKYYGRHWLINIPADLLISEKDVIKIREISYKFERQNKKIASHDDLVAQMTFGFWCAFFHRKYDPIIWHRKDAIKIIFPNLVRANRKRSYLEEKLLKIKKIRNRIAHHEPIWNQKVSIHDAYSMSQNLIYTISQEAFDMLKTIDRFPKVYKKFLMEMTHDKQTIQIKMEP